MAEDGQVRFDALRRRGVHYAQQASGSVWTDYNVHDPGITLLEQTAFALTELAYRADLPVRDLLSEDGRLPLAERGLGAAASVLASAPVAATDLALMLSDLPQVARVLVSGQTGGGLGLIDLTVWPAPGVADDTAKRAVRRAFHEVRPLATDLGTVRVARPVPYVLRGIIEIAPGDPAERIAARVYDACALLLLNPEFVGPGADADAAPDKVGRAELYNDPSAFFGKADRRASEVPEPEEFVAAARAVEGVRNVPWLEVYAEDPAVERGADGPTYRKIVPPSFGQENPLTVMRNSQPLPLNVLRLRAAYARLGAERLAAVTGRLDRREWQSTAPGTRLSLRHTAVDAKLPQDYVLRAQGGSARLDDAPTRQLTGYRKMIDTILASGTGALADLPGFFDGRAGDAPTYAFDHTAWDATPAVAGPAAMAAASVAARDPAAARRLRILDYLIALQGEQWPEDGNIGLERYHAAGEHPNAAIARRARLLRDLPALNRSRGCGPVLTAAGGGPASGGFAAKLCCFLDIQNEDVRPMEARLRDSGLRIVPRHETPVATVARGRIFVPYDPLDMLVPRRAVTADIDPAAILSATPCLAAGEITESALRAAILTDSYLINPAPGGRWRAVFDPGGGDDLYDIGVFDDKSRAIDHANRLRQLLTDVNRTCETCHVVEPVVLRQADFVGRGFECLVLLTGWTARGADDVYRRFAEDIVRRLAPAHVQVSVRWMNAAEQVDIDTAIGAWRRAKSAALHRGDAEAVRRAAEAGRALAALLRLTPGPLPPSPTQTTGGEGPA